jgi:hypothetical protein
MMNPWIILATVLALMGVVGGAEYNGYSRGEAKITAEWDIAKAKQMKDTADEITHIQTQLNSATADLEKAKNERQIIYKTITKKVDRIVDRPVYLNACIDDDGLRLANAALTGKAATDPGQPDPAVPAADAVGRKDGR